MGESAEGDLSYHVAASRRIGHRVSNELMREFSMHAQSVREAVQFYAASCRDGEMPYSFGCDDPNIAENVVSAIRAVAEEFVLRDAPEEARTLCEMCFVEGLEEGVKGDPQNH